MLDSIRIFRKKKHTTTLFHAAYKSYFENHHANKFYKKGKNDQRNNTQISVYSDL